jgi:uncharacterized membrane protein
MLIYTPYLALIGLISGIIVGLAVRLVIRRTGKFIRGDK